MRILMILLAGLPLGAAPDAKLTPAQWELNKERNRLWAQARDEWKAGKRAEAVATMSKVRAVTEGIVGKNSLYTSEMEDWLAGWEAERGRWAEAAAHRKQMWVIT